MWKSFGTNPYQLEGSSDVEREFGVTVASYDDPVGTTGLRTIFVHTPWVAEALRGEPAAFRDDQNSAE